MFEYTYRIKKADGSWKEVQKGDPEYDSHFVAEYDDYGNLIREVPVGDGADIIVTFVTYDNGKTYANDQERWLERWQDFDVEKLYEHPTLKESIAEKLREFWEKWGPKRRS